MTRLKGKEVFDVMEVDTPTFTDKSRSIRVPCLLAAFALLIFLFSLSVSAFLFYKNIECYEENTSQQQLQQQQRSSSVAAGGLLNSSTTWPDESYYSDYHRQLMMASSSGSLSASSSVDLRLPRSVKPHSYHIEIVPFIWEGNFTFHGYVSILLNVTRHTKNVTLHAHKLNMSSDWSAYRIPLPIVNEAAKPEERIRIVDVANDTRKQFLIFQFADYLEPEYQYRLNIRYVGHLNDHMEGFYRSSYKAGNKKRWIAATQFQATDARQAFPCFDEPSMKAKFTLNIARPSHMNTLSNMPISKHAVPMQGISNYVMDEYRESVPMSTYLVAFAVTDFHELSDGRFHVWAREDAIEQARYAMSVGPKILSFYEQYFGIQFPLPKIDMIALPDFSSGAMENWGLITYRETTMLYQNGVSTRYNKENVAAVIAHELAHQWFGNLVTPEWWSDLWLNEGFATYTEYVGTDAIEPSWRVLEQFVVEELHTVLSLDALLSSHPISVQVNDPNEINEIFDGISYNKGAAIIRMMDHFLTKAVFKRGVNNYLKSKSYQCATQDDLWEALTTQAHRDGVLDKTVTVKQIMDTWTLQTGFPVVTVVRDYNNSSSNGRITVSQSRFVLNLDRKLYKQNKTLWWIPLTYTTQAALNFQNTQPTHWLKAEEQIVIDNIGVKPDHWLLFNVKETGYYRVNYDYRNWQLLIKALNDPEHYQTIEPLNRAQLINDAMRLAHAGLLNYTVALDVTQYLQHEVEYIPWRAAFNDLEYIDNMLHKTVSYNKYKVYVLHLLSKLYESTGFAESPADDQLTIYRRVEVLNQACHLGYDDCLRNAVNQFQNWKHNPQPDENNPISPNLKGIVYCTAIRIGGQNEWEFGWQRYLKSNVASEKDILLMALGCSREPWILSRYLEWSLDENSGIKKQDMIRVFRSVSMNVIGQPLAWAIIRDHWERITAYLGTSLFGLSSIIKATFRNINTEYELRELIKFAAVHRNSTGSANRAVAQAIERAESNVKWTKMNYKIITSWLDAKITTLPTFDNVT